jgi:hypothetical protein
MAIPDYARTNFETLVKAAKAGDLALMECTEVDSGEIRYVLCAVGREEGDYVMTPFCHLAPGNPYDAYVPPA